MSGKIVPYNLANCQADFMSFFFSGKLYVCGFYLQIIYGLQKFYKHDLTFVGPNNWQFLANLDWFIQTFRQYF